MTKRIAILGASPITAVIIGLLATNGFDPIHPRQVDHKPNKFKKIDLTNDYKKPVNSYQAKQRAKKLRRKAK